MCLSYFGGLQVTLIFHEEFLFGGLQRDLNYFGRFNFLK